MENAKPQITPTYHPLYIGTAVVLVILLGLTIWGFISKQAASDSLLQAGDLQINKTEVLADGVDSSEVTITVTQKDSNNPVSDVWVGLQIEDEQLITQELSNFGWYSPEPGRSFYQTNNQGLVQFSVRSKISGQITYGIYAADPEQTNSGKYQSLNRQFTITFK